ncbi:EEF1A lysine methyltransferase 3-like [Mustelus asterias]
MKAAWESQQSNIRWYLTAIDPAVVLCQYFQDQKFDFTGKKVLELGSGTGLVGILAVLLGGHVTITDVSETLRQIEYNVAANIPVSSKHRSKVRALYWGTDHHEYPSDFDFILGSDIVYSPSQFSNIVETLLHCSNKNTTIFFCTNMLARMGARDFHNEVVPKKFDSDQVYTDGVISIYKMSKKSAS